MTESISCRTKLPPIAILAGGLAMRLRPLTETIPKALVEIAGRPFIDWQLELLAKQGVERVVVCAGHLGKMIEAQIGDGARFGLDVSFSYDGETLLGTGGAIRKALPLLGDEFFVLYGDSYLPIDYRAVANAFTAATKQGLMTVYKNDGHWDASNVWMEGAEVRLYDKMANLPQMRHIDYGLSIFRHEAFSRHNEGERFDLAGVMADLVDRREMAAFAVAERFYEIGSLEGIADLEKLLRRANRAVFFDRDGILNEIVMRAGVVESPRTAGEFRLKDGAKELFQAARAAGFLCIVVTNQPDIERGLLAQAELDAMHQVLAEELSLDGIEVCPAGSADDRRKKPNPGMLLDAATRWRIDLRQSWIVGDSIKDIDAGRRAGVSTILLATDYNREVHDAADYCFPSLAEIAGFLSTVPQPSSP
jgi:histidinol-phosphate phosphatase family protein